MSFWMGFASGIKDTLQRKHERELFMEKTAARQDEILLEGAIKAGVDSAKDARKSAEDAAKAAAEEEKNLEEQYMTAVNAMGGSDEAHDIAASLMYSGQIGGFNARVEKLEGDLDPDFVAGVLRQAREIHGDNFDYLSETIYDAFGKIPKLTSDEGRRELLVQMTGDPEYVSKPLTVEFTQVASPTGTSEYGVLERAANDYLTSTDFKGVATWTGNERDGYVMKQGTEWTPERARDLHAAKALILASAQDYLREYRDIPGAISAGQKAWESYIEPEVVDPPEVSTAPGLGAGGEEPIALENDADAIQAMQLNPQYVNTNTPVRMPTTVSRPTQPPNPPVTTGNTEEDDYGWTSSLSDNFNN